MSAQTPDFTDWSLDRLLAAPVAAILPPGCDLPGCRHHYAPGRNLAAEGCICPAWFDGGGWHLIEQNPACAAHQMEG